MPSKINRKRVERNNEYGTWSTILLAVAVLSAFSVDRGRTYAFMMHPITFHRGIGQDLSMFSSVNAIEENGGRQNILAKVNISSVEPLAQNVEGLAQSSGEPKASTPNRSLFEIASSITLEQCKLLGVKSIGVDYGLVRTGVAVTVGYEPKALDILSDLTSTQVCERIIHFAKVEHASKIIVGLPLHKNGTVAEQTNLTLVFAEQLAVGALTVLGPQVPVELWDERYTSKEAAARAHAKDPNRFLYGSLDADAACIILEHYYNENGQGRIVVPVPEPLQEECLRKFELNRSKEDQERKYALLERTAMLQRRRDFIAQNQNAEESNNTGSKKKKKKRRR